MTRRVITSLRRAGLSAVLLLCFVTSSLAAPAEREDWETLKTEICRLLPRGAEVGILAVEADSRFPAAGGTVIDTLECRNSTRAFIPASNLKLLTTGAALLCLGADHQFRTAISYSGSVNGSTLEGDLYLVGDGDPTLGASYASSKPLDEVMEFIYAQLEEAGITSIDGAVIADGRCYASATPHDDWDAGDKGFYFGAEVHGINFYENVIDYEVSPMGDSLRIVQRSPLSRWKSEYPSAALPWLRFSSIARVGEKGTGDKLYYDTSAEKPEALMHGTLACDRKTARERCTNMFPEYTFAAAVYDYLRDRAVNISDGYAFVAADGALVRFDDQKPRQERRAASVDDLVTMGRLSSPPLGDIIRETNHESDNLYAEALLKAMGSYFLNSGQTADGIMAEKAVISSALGMDLSWTPVADGCGLSRANRLTPSQIVDFLGRMYLTSSFPTFLVSLPNPGEGTLEPLLKGFPAQLKSRIYMKSGSMSGVRCYSGYILPETPGDRTVIFSILSGRDSQCPDLP